METESDENFSLDNALSKLDMLSTITDARREYLNEMRLRGVRPGNSSSSWRYQRSEPSNINGSPSATLYSKETFRQRSHSSSGLQNGSSELSTLHNGSNSHLNKLQQSRHRCHHSRISPYGYSSISRRRPLNTLGFGSSTGSTSTSTTSSGSTSSICSMPNTEDISGLTVSSALTSFTHFLKEHHKLQQKYLEQMKAQEVSPTLLPGTSKYTPYHGATSLFQQNGLQNQELEKPKSSNSTNMNATVGTGEVFPVPSLTRSKSLEDLRESIRPKPKSLSSYFSGNNSLDASSLSPRNNCDLTTFHQAFQTANVAEDCQIKKEIDSMSMRIGNLDVG